MNYLKLRKKIHNFAKKGGLFKTSLAGLAIIELNIAEACNRRCSFCPRSENYPNLKKYMSLDTVENIIKNCLEYNYAGAISIAGFGEPFLNKNIIETIKKIKSSLKNFTYIITNGDFINKDNVNKLFNFGLDLLVVSCYDEATYNKCNSILNEYKDKYFLKKLWGNEHQLIVNNNFNNRAGTVKKIVSILKQKECYFPFYHLFIDWDGKVLLCPNDWSKQNISAGNINNNSLVEIWNSEGLNNYRKNLFAGKRDLSPCNKCTVKGDIIGKSNALLHKKIRS